MKATKYDVRKATYLALGQSLAEIWHFVSLGENLKRLIMFLNLGPTVQLLPKLFLVRLDYNREMLKALPDHYQCP